MKTDANRQYHSCFYGHADKCGLLPFMRFSGCQRPLALYASLSALALSDKNTERRSWNLSQTKHLFRHDVSSHFPRGDDALAAKPPS